MSSFSVAGVIAQLHSLGVDASCVIKHDATKTVSEQIKAVEGHEGTVTKNLVFKDGKQRYYLCTCLHDTVVDQAKVMPVRLGLTKKEFRMAAAADLLSILAVPEGHVTPLAACQACADRVVLLLDERLKSTPFFVHPMDNSMSVRLTHSQLESFLRSHGREAHYVDFSIGVVSELKVDKDHPPDLKALADTVAPLKSEAEAPPAPAAAKSKAANVKPKETSFPTSATPLDSVPECINAIMDRVRSALGSEVMSSLSTEKVAKLKKDMEVELNAFRNASYARGMLAERGAVMASLTREWQ